MDNNQSGKTSQQKELVKTITDLEEIKDRFWRRMPPIDGIHFKQAIEKVQEKINNML
jgi:hypothetical protein